jgi:hypothetical protein
MEASDDHTQFGQCEMLSERAEGPGDGRESLNKNAEKISSARALPYKG